MGWCEANAIDFIFGLAKNAHLTGTIEAELADARNESRHAASRTSHLTPRQWPPPLRRCLLRSRRDGERDQGMSARSVRDRTSARSLAIDQLRLWFASMAYVLVKRMRRLALRGPISPTCSTIPHKLLKIGALVTISVCRIKFAMASGCPYKGIFATTHHALDTT
jgi:hypothetical protein